MKTNDIAWIEVELEKSQKIEDELRALLAGMEEVFPAATLRRTPAWLRAKNFLRTLDGSRSIGIGYITINNEKK
jgi:hypothetical protein